MSQNTEKEIKQYKDFTTITNLRKLTQQAINPVIKSLQQQLSLILIETTELKKKSARIDDILKNQQITDENISDTKESIRKFKDEMVNQKKIDEKRNHKLQNANEKVFIEIHGLKTTIKGQDDVMAQMKNKNDKMANIFSTLETRNQQSLKEIQYKYTNFTKQVLEMNKMIKVQYSQNKTENQVMKKTFKRERAEMEEKFKAIQLYFSERQVMNNKIEQIYSIIMNHVSKEEFQGFRLSQKKLFQETVEKMQKKIIQILPPSLQKILPSIETRLKQVDKIPKIVQRIKDEEEKSKKIQKQLKKNKQLGSKELAEVIKKFQNENFTIRQILKEKITEVRQSIQETQNLLNQKITNTQEQLQQTMVNHIEKETSVIYKTIEEQVKSQHIQIQTQNKQEIQAQIQEIKDIKNSILARYNKIQEVGSSIDHRIQSYSSRITRIRSDYELFSEQMRKQMRETLKFKGQFSQRLKNIGGILSTYAEMLLINGSFILQNNLDKEGGTQVFVTNNDGIIYEWKGVKNKICFRKNKADPRTFATSFMYSMTTYIDEIFGKYQFLNWAEQKPSIFFKQRVLNNYNLHMDREKNPNQNNNQNICEDETEFVETHPLKFSKTIQSKGKNERSLADNMNCFTEAKRTYSIKKQKVIEKSRYEHGFLTSRSGCKSRISQIF